MDLSRLRWEDVPLIAKDSVSTDHGTHYERILKGGFSQPEWGDEGPVFNMQYCHFVVDGHPRQLSSFSIPATLLHGLRDAIDKAIRQATEPAKRSVAFQEGKAATGAANADVSGGDRHE